MLRICAIFVLACLPLAALSGLIGSAGSSDPTDLAGPTGAIQVIDADTWDVGGYRVRLFGIDAPEQDQTCKKLNGAIWTCGAWATRQTRQRYASLTARCDAVDNDRYGRIVARCFVDGQDVGAALVDGGLAFAYHRYSQDYVGLHDAAQAAGRGLHTSEMIAPAQFRAARRVLAPSSPVNGGCKIKGNISSAGRHIYHLPGQRHYARTKISTRKGEQWFCSEYDAQNAGWRRARR